MYLRNGKGQLTEVRVGLVDDTGVFLTLLDGMTQIRRYKWSDESDLITQLVANNDELREMLEKNSKELKNKSEASRMAKIRMSNVRDQLANACATIEHLTEVLHDHGITDY